MRHRATAEQVLESLVEALRDPRAQESRAVYCKAIATAFQECGNVLWAFGLSDTKPRRALAIAAQMAGALGGGSIQLLRDSNWYAAAALVRQLVEIEYLLFLFSDDPAECERWLSSSSEDMRHLYSPAAMRKRSEGRFRNEEYWTHCTMGGHPNPRAHRLLPERVLRGSDPWAGSGEALWADLAQHLDGAWGSFATATTHEGLLKVQVVSRWMREAQAARVAWQTTDSCARRLPVSMFENSKAEP